MMATEISTSIAGRDPIAYQGERVMTTAMAAEAFGTEESVLINNFNRNRDRFETGKHLHRIEGADLRTLKDSISLRGSVGANARTVLLWTERGIARHAKILETDTAWEIFESLEDTYFRVRAAGSPSPRLPVPREVASAFRSYASIGKLIGLDRNQTAIAANQATLKTTGVNVLEMMGTTHLTAPTQDRLLTPTEIGGELDMNARAVNAMLAVRGYQFDGPGGWTPTPKGEPWGVIQDVGKAKGSGTPVRQLKWRAGIIDELRAGKADAA